MKAPLCFHLINNFLIDILQWCARAICHPTNQPVIRHRKQQRHLLIYRRTTSATSNHQRQPRGNVRITQICRKKDKEFINASHAMTSKWLEPIMVPRSWCTFFAQTLGPLKLWESDFYWFQNPAIVGFMLKFLCCLFCEGADFTYLVIVSIVPSLTNDFSKYFPHSLTGCRIHRHFESYVGRRVEILFTPKLEFKAYNISLWNQNHHFSEGCRMLSFYESSTMFANRLFLWYKLSDICGGKNCMLSMLKWCFNWRYHSAMCHTS